jgi:hypothetical protein
MASLANLPTGYSSCWFPRDIMINPFYDLHSYEPNKGELLFKILVSQFGHKTKKARMCVIMIPFSRPGFMDRRCSETPQFMTHKMDIWGIHSAEGHCCLQYSKLYSASFEITNWIDHLFTTIFCSHRLSPNEPPLETPNMAPSGAMFGS